MTLHVINGGKNAVVLETPEERHSTAGERTLLVLLVALLATAVLAFGAFEPLPQFILRAGTMLLLTAWVVTGLFQSRVDVRIPSVLLPALAFAGLALIQLLFHRTAYSNATWGDLTNLTAYIVLMFLAAQLLRTWTLRQWFLRLTAGFGGLLACFTLAQYFAGNGKIYWLRSTIYAAVIFGPYVDHGTYCATALFLLPCAIVLAIRPQRAFWPRAVGGFSAVLVATTILISGSRSGIIAAVIQVFALLLYVRRGDRRIARTGMIIAVSLIVATLALIAWLNTGEITARLATLGNPAAAGAVRIQILRDTWPMLKVHPFLGFGLGTFSTVYPEYRSFVSEYFINFAHNEYAQVFVETGLAGFAIVLWLFFLLFRRQDGETAELPGIRLAGTAACIGALVHSAFTFELHTPANAAWFAIMCVAATLRIPSSPRMHPDRYRVEPVSILAGTSEDEIGPS